MFYPVHATVLLNSGLVNGDPLSETMVQGSPCVENVCRNRRMVAAVVADVMTCASMYFEYASTMTKIISPSNGPM